MRLRTNTLSGSQSHLSDASGTADALKALAAVAPEVAITELDIAGSSAADWQTVVQACLDLENCVGITAWGMLITMTLNCSDMLTSTQVFLTLNPGGLARTRSSSTKASSPRRPILRSLPPFRNKLGQTRVARGVTGCLRYSLRPFAITVNTTPSHYSNGSR